MGKYTIDEVIRALKQKGCIVTENEGITVNLSFWHNERLETRKTRVERESIAINNSKKLGNSSWGKIDFLTKNYGFKLYGLSTYRKRCEINDVNDDIRKNN